jgi:hypothetical protein
MGTFDWSWVGGEPFQRRKGAMRDFANAQSTTSETAPRIIMVDEHEVEVPPLDNLVVIRNDDRPGMIGLVGTAFGDAGVNISHYGVGHSAKDEPARRAGRALAGHRRRPCLRRCRARLRGTAP